MKNSRDQRIEELLYILGGVESSILFAMEQKDWDFAKVLKKQKLKLYERLRRVSYGLPEKSPLETEE